MEVGIVVKVMVDGEMKEGRKIQRSSLAFMVFGTRLWKVR